MLTVAASLAVVTLAVIRITLAVSVDRIGKPIRDLASRWGVVDELVLCTDCLSFWVALAAVTAYWFEPYYTTLFCLPWAVAMVAAWGARRY